MAKNEIVAVDTQTELFERLHNYLINHDIVHFRKTFKDQHFYDQGMFYQTLTHKEREEVMTILSPKEMGDMFDTLEDDDENTQKYLREMDPQYAADMLNAMYDDNAADILEHLDEQEVNQYLDRMPEKDANKLSRLLHYGNETAGGIMTTELIRLEQNLTIETAINKVKRDSELAETIYYLYIVDDEQQLVGVMSLRDLLVAPNDEKVKKVMNKNVISVKPEVEQADVAHTIRDYGFLAIPVVDSNDHLIGMVTVDDIIEVIDDEAQSDYSGLAGVNVEDVTEEPTKAATRRLPWLITLLFLGMLTATLVNHFEVLLSEASILAVFISLITGTAGNAGTQSLAVAVRRLALSNNEQPSIGKMILSEIVTGLIIGLATGGTITVVVGLWKSNFVLGAVIGLAMAAAIWVANMAGSLIPMLMERLGFDPAVASGPFISTLSDLTSVLIYFNIAAIFLPYIS